MTLEEVLVSVNTSVSSQIATFDIQLNDNSSPAGTSIFSTQPQIDVNDTFSLTSVTPAVLATTSLSRGDELSFWSDQR